MADTVQDNRRNAEPRRRSVQILAALVLLLGMSVLATLQAHSQTFTVLYAFGSGTDGGTPYSGLIRDRAGNLYGTTSGGGTGSNGTVFKLDTAGKESVLYNFKGGKDGGFPFAGLTRGSNGALYGTTVMGGASKFGTVFKVNPAGQEHVLYSFASDNGSYPDAGLRFDSAGNLYGTTVKGGSSDLGTVFQLNPQGKQTVLHTFAGGQDGSFSYTYGSLARDPAGNFYGTTLAGGISNQGTVFKVDTSGNETVLHSFSGGSDGGFPYAGVILDGKGNLYGTTYLGGASGQGVVFKLTSAGKLVVLFSFTGGADGGNPTAPVIRDGKGNLYGTAYIGGLSNSGVVFKLDPHRIETVLHNFDYANDGGYPTAGLIRDSAGNLYGTASAGGTSNHGTVFKIAP